MAEACCCRWHVSLEESLVCRSLCRKVKFAGEVFTTLQCAQLPRFPVCVNQIPNWSMGGDHKTYSFFIIEAGEVWSGEPSLCRVKKIYIYYGLVWFSFLFCSTKINVWTRWAYEQGPLVLAVSTLWVFTRAVVCAPLRERAPFAKLMFGFWVVPELLGAPGSFGPSTCSEQP